MIMRKLTHIGSPCLKCVTLLVSFDLGISIESIVWPFVLLFESKEVEVGVITCGYVDILLQQRSSFF